MIHFSCPRCSDTLSVPDSVGGQHETCPGCGNVCLVPAQVPPQVPAPASQAAQPAVHVHVSPAHGKTTSGLGIAGLVLGILACLTAWIPLVGLLAVPVAALGLLFGILGFLGALLGRKSGTGMPLSACLVCGAAIMMQALWVGGLMAYGHAKESATQPAAVKPAE